MVLESGGIDLLLRCADMRLWPEVVTVALWNICAESDNPVNAPIRPHVEEDSPSGQKFAAAEPNISTIACIQLTLRSTGECDDSNGPSTVADKIADAKRHTNIITELLDLSDVVKDESRKEMVVELLEKASWHRKCITSS